MEILTKNEEKPQQLKRFKTLRKNIRGAFHSADNRRFPGAEFCDSCRDIAQNSL